MPLCPGRDGVWLTRGDAVHAAARLRSRFAAGGGGPGSNVLIAVEDRYALLLTAIAVWQSGARVVLPPNHLPATIEHVRSVGGVDMVVGESIAVSDDAIQVTPSDLEPMNTDVSEVVSDRSELCLQGNGSHPLLTVYTSGTTGSYQRCDKTASQLFGEALMLTKTFAFDTASIVAATVPGHHLYGLLFSVLVPVFSGARFLRPCFFQPSDIDQAAARFGITDLVTVPTHIKALERTARLRAPSLRRVFSSGAALDPGLARRFTAGRSLELVDVLGSTESGGIGFREPAKTSTYATFAGVDVDADDESRLMLRSPYMNALGDEQRWCLLPDRIRKVEAGFVYLGRTDGIVKIGGKRVALQQVEALARTLVGVDDAVAIGHSSDLRGHEVWLAVASAKGGIDAVAIRGGLERYFDAVALPRRCLVVAEFPRTALGKVDRQALRRLFQEQDGSREP